MTQASRDADARRGGHGPLRAEILGIDPSPAATSHPAGLAIVRWWLKARRLREDMFGPGLFADPAWDIMLDLYAAAARGQSVQISSLALAARVPHSTAIRWAGIMTRAGIVVREKDPRDARCIHVSLSAGATALMEDFLARLSGEGQLPPAIVPKASSP